jgi:glucokinase
MEEDSGALIGLDIGGQSIKGLRLERDGRASRRGGRATPREEGRDAVLDAARSLLGELLEPGPAASVGVGTPGGADKAGRISGLAANIPNWSGTPLGLEMSKAARAPAFVRNDGNLAAFGEWAVRASVPGEASRAFLFVGLGTGIGGGYVEDGNILSGVDDKALEIGHLIVHPDGRKCSCGRSGCVEAYASGPSIGRLAMELSPGYDSPLARAVRGGLRLNAREVYEAFAEDDELAKAAHAVAVEALSRAIGAALAFLAPDTVVLGGGVLAGARSLVSEVASMSPNFVFKEASEGVRFEEALLGTEAGLIGASLYGAAQVLPREDFLELAGKARPPKD